MPRLTPQQYYSRLKFDAEVAMGLEAPWLLVEAFPNARRLKPKDRIRSPAYHRPPKAYVVTYSFDTLGTGGVRQRPTVILFDTEGGRNYPFGEPNVTVLKDRCSVPWSPHFASWSGAVCLGDRWGRSRGSMLLGQLIVHVARLLNFDEPRKPGYAGWNGAAVAYWERSLGGRPVNPDLRYPQLPLEVTHGDDAAMDKPTSGFRVKTGAAKPRSGGFKVGRRGW